MLEHAALLDARSGVGADELERDRRLDRLVEPDPQQVDVDRLAADRVADQLLDHDRSRGFAVDAQIEHRAGVLKGKPQGSRIDLERHRVRPAAVHDPGHVSLAAKAPRGARPGGLAACDGEDACCGGHGGGRW